MAVVQNTYTQTIYRTIQLTTWLEGFLGFEPRMVKLKLTMNCVKIIAVPRLCKLYPGICLTTEEKHGKTSVRVENLSHGCIQIYSGCSAPTCTSVATGLDVVLCHWVSGYHISRTYFLECLTLHKMMAHFFKMLGTVTPVTQHHIPEELNPHANIYIYIKHLL